jgi:hypothetical protein
MEETATENLELTEAKSNGAAKQRIKSRISLVKNRLRLPVNAAVASTAVTDYVNISQKNPRLSHYGILQKMSGPRRDALSAINSAVPVRMIVNAPDTQLRRTIRDILKEQKMELNEQFNPPAMLLLKREAIRMFPNGQRVALYVDNKYGLTFPVPYDQSGTGFKSMNTVSPGPLNAQRGYVNEEVLPVVFSTGEEINVEKDIMDKIKSVFDSLNEENKQRLSDMVLESPETFNKVKEFALLIK